MNALGLRVAAGHFAWTERRLFEVLGGWVPSVPEAEVKVFLRSQSFEHAWHAQLWHDLEPRSGPVVGAAADGGGLAGVLDAVAEPADTLARLVGVYRVVLARLVDAYGALSDAAVPACDGPLVRALGLMLADQVPALEDAERLIATLGGDAAAHQGRIEALLGKVGGVGIPETE